MDDASLDDFLGDESSDDGAAAADSESDGDGAATTDDETDGSTESEDAPATADTDASTPTGAGSDGDSTVDGDAPAEGDDGTASGDGGRVDPAAVDPATTTYAWSPEGAACAECGAETGRRWEQDGHLVCPDCKAW